MTRAASIRVSVVVFLVTCLAMSSALPAGWAAAAPARTIDLAQQAEGPQAAGGATLVVNWDGSGDYSTIQEALNAAGEGDTVVVMPSVGAPAGAYVENLTFPALGITLENSDLNDPTMPGKTIIDGGGVDRVVTFDEGAPATAVIDGFTIQNGTATQGGGLRCANGAPVIRNCVVTGNSADEGGGMLLWNGSVSLESCTFTGNSATSTGGGVHCSGYGAAGVNPTLTDCVISDNTVDEDWAYGGGVSCSGIDVTLTGCTISNNDAGSAGRSGASGGGVYAHDCTVVLNDCTISDNATTGDQGSGGGLAAMMATTEINGGTVSGNILTVVDYCSGGGIGSNWGDITITDCDITGNSVVGGWPIYDNGGGGVSSYAGDLTLVECNIYGNESASTGGGVLCIDGTTDLTRCNISNNSALGGGGLMAWEVTLEARSCVITWNYADVDGGGMLADTGDATLTNCTVAHNSTGEFGFGGGISTSDMVLNLANCILWGDSALAGSELSINYSDPGVGSQAYVAYSDVAGGADEVHVGTSSTLYWLDGNHDVDPAFADVDGPDGDSDTWNDNDFHLALASPCQNLGDPAFAPLPDETDIDGDPRVQYCLVDLGADEATDFADCNGNEEPDGCDIYSGISLDCNLNYVPDECESPPPGDFDDDGDVDLDDYANLVACLAGPGVAPEPADPQCAQFCLDVFDADADNDVDLYDYADFANSLGAQ